MHTVGLTYKSLKSKLQLV